MADAAIASDPVADGLAGSGVVCRYLEARIAELAHTHEQLVSLAHRAAQDPRDCQGYCSIMTG